MYDLFNNCTQGLVVGTLIYVVCFEILNRERDRKTYSIKKARAIGFIQFLALGAGLVAMGLLATMSHDHGGDDHGHDHEDDHDHPTTHHDDHDHPTTHDDHDGHTHF